MVFPEMPRVGRFARGDLLWRAGHDDLPAAPTAVGTKVDYMICGLDHIEVMFDAEHRMARVGKTVQAVEQSRDVRKVQTRGGLIEDVEHVPPSEAWTTRLRA